MQKSRQTARVDGLITIKCILCTILYSTINYLTTTANIYQPNNLSTNTNHHHHHHLFDPVRLPANDPKAR